MAGFADVVVRFIGDTKQLDDDLQKVDKTTRGVGDTFRGLGRQMATVFGGVAIGAFVRSSVDAASDMAESQNKLKAVFEDSTKDIRKSLNGLVADILGSKKTAVDAAGTFGNMFQQMGLATGDVTKFSKGLLTLTADLVSFHNADPTEVVLAIGAAFRGEYDSLQRFIPTITAAAVEHRALADTGKATAEQLTAAEKAAATYALVIEGAGKATGDAARTADSAANQQRKLHRQFEEMSVQIGQALLPLLLLVVPVLTDLAEAFSKATPSIQNATIALAAFAAVAIAIGGPIGLIVAALGLIVAAAYLVWTNWDKIWNWIKDHPAYAVIFAILAAPIAWFILIIGALRVLYDNWDRIWGAITGTVETAKNAIVNAFNAVVGFFQGLPGRVAGAVASIFGILVAPFVNAYEAIVGIPGQIAGAFSGLAGLILGAVGSLYHVGVQIMESLLNGIESVVGRIKNKIASVAGDIAGALNPFGSPQTKAFYTGQNVMRDYLAGVESIAPRVQRAMSSIGGELAPALAGSGSSSTYNISVSVAAGAAPAAVGAAVVDQIRAYERLNGKAWRQ